MAKKNTKPRLETDSLVREGEHKSDRVFKTVRRLALQQQKDAPQLFLSLRQATKRFDVPVSAMASVYRRLMDEGILSSVRSSRTILRGRKSSRNLRVSGVIGMPVSAPRLDTLRDYRESYLSLRDELHARGFSIIPFHFEERAIDPEHVVRRAKEEHVDTVIWLLPEGAVRQTALRLRDLGLRFIGVNIGGISNAFCRYEVRRRQAIFTILNHWRADADTRATIIVLGGQETAAEMERIARLRGAISTEGITCRVDTVPEGRISRFLKSLCAKENDVLLPAHAAAMLGSRAPDTVAEVFKTCRVALIDGPLDAPFCKAHPEITVDFVTVNWKRIGKRIAQDILSGDAFVQSETTIFEAESHLQTPIASMPEGL
jgi:hypothetical protein